MVINFNLINSAHTLRYSLAKEERELDCSMHQPSGPIRDSLLKSLIESATQNESTQLSQQFKESWI